MEEEGGGDTIGKELGGIREVKRRERWEFKCSSEEVRVEEERRT